MSEFITLKNRAQFVAVSNKGKSIATKGLVLQYLLHSSDNTSLNSYNVGFTATKKIGGAVVRNRIKRRLRALVREVFGTLARTDCDYVLIGRFSTMKRDFSALKKDLKYALHQVDKG